MRVWGVFEVFEIRVKPFHVFRRSGFVGLVGDFHREQCDGAVVAADDARDVEFRHCFLRHEVQKQDPQCFLRKSRDIVFVKGGNVCAFLAENVDGRHALWEKEHGGWGCLKADRGEA